MLTIKRAALEDLDAITRLFWALWPEHTEKQLRGEFAELLSGEDNAVFLGMVEGNPVAAAQCGLRHDYVEGTGSSPVGYLEGTYVAPGFRRQGIARQLCGACESWARDRGCTEFASDCEIDNIDSFHFHLALGFLEAGRSICFTKTLE